MTSRLVDEFMKETSADREIAIHYLSKSEYDLKNALKEYYKYHPKDARNPDKQVAWYSGGSKSAIATLAPESANANEQEQKPNYTATSIKSASKPIQIPSTNSLDISVNGEQKLRVRLDYKIIPPQTLTVSNSTTVGEIREFIKSHHKEFAEGNFNMTIASSNKLLEDNSATVLSENLKMQMIKITY